MIPTVVIRKVITIAEAIVLGLITERITVLTLIDHDPVNVTLADRAVVRLTPKRLVNRPIEEAMVGAVAVAVLGTVASSLMIVGMEVIVDTTLVIVIDVIMSVTVPILRLIGAPGVQVTTIPSDVDTTHAISVRTRLRRDLTFGPRRLTVDDRMKRQRRLQQSLLLLSSVHRRHTHVGVHLRHHDLSRLIQTPPFRMG